MSITSHITDKATGTALHITEDGALAVSMHPHPLDSEATNILPFRAYLTNSSGSNDMRVNGATTNVEFYIEADPEYNIYIKTFSVLIADASAVLNKFGNLSALTNGIEFTQTSQDAGTQVLHDGIKTNLEFIRLGLSTAAVGDGTSAFRSELSGSGAESYLPTIDVTQTFGVPWGLRLRRGSKDRISFTVRDNLFSGMDALNIITYGTKI